MRLEGSLNHWILFCLKSFGIPSNYCCFSSFGRSQDPPLCASLWEIENIKQVGALYCIISWRVSWSIALSTTCWGSFNDLAANQSHRIGSQCRHCRKWKRGSPALRVLHSLPFCLCVLVWGCFGSSLRIDFSLCENVQQGANRRA